MNRQRLALITLLAITPLLPQGAQALSMNQVAAICASRPGNCNEHPLMQAYVGGALDLIAMLDEETDYLGQVYCKTPGAFFDVPAIISYMQSQQKAYGDKNAMLVVIRWLEDNGGC